MPITPYGYAVGTGIFNADGDSPDADQHYGDDQPSGARLPHAV